MNDKHNNKKELTVERVVNKNQDSKPNLQRRNALLGAATGASLIAWHKPLINAVVLPLHAQTSGVAAAFFGANVAAGPVAKASNLLLDLIIPEAIAGTASATQNYTVSVAPANADNTSFTIGLFEDLGATQGFDVAQVVYQGTVSTTSGGTLNATENPCGLEGIEAISVEIVEASANSVVLNLTNRSQSITVPAGDGVLPSAQCVGGAVARVFSIEGFSSGSATTKSSLLELIIPTANAGVPVSSNSTYSALAQETAAGSNLFDITVLERIDNPQSQLFTAVESSFSGQVAGPGTGTLALASAGCDEAPMDSITAEITGVSDSALELQLSNREVIMTLQPVAITIPAPSCELIPTADSFFQPGDGGIINRKSAFGSLLDLVIPEANAGESPSPTAFGVLATKMGTQEFSIQLLNIRGSLIRTGTLNIDGTTGSLTPNLPLTCPGEFEGTPRDIPATIIGVDESTLRLQIETGRQGIIILNVPDGSGSLNEICGQIIQQG